MSLTNHHHSGANWSDTSRILRPSRLNAEQREETRQALEAFRAALKEQSTAGMQQAKAMQVWCKECRQGFKLGFAAVNKELECFQLLCPSCRELFLQIRTNNTAALGVLARLFTVSLSVPDELEGHAEEVEHCVWAFRQHDYQRCLDLAVPLVRSSKHSYLAQLLIVSAQRLGLDDLAQQAGQIALGPTANLSPWEAVLLRLTLGLIGPEEALKAARSDSDRYRVYFYSAARLITSGDKRKAKELLKRCLQFEISCLERPLAESELELV